MHAVLKKISELSAIVVAGEAKIEQHRTDILRAIQATLEAQKIADELTALSRKRAELKAQAFFSKTTADTSELDKQEKALERAGRQAVEDGQAAELAIEMLQEQINTTEEELGGVQEDRKQLTVQWLKDHRHKAIERYIAALNALGQPLADAFAVDQLLNSLDARDLQTGDWLLRKVRNIGIAVPHSYKIERPGRQGQSEIYDVPVAWFADESLGLAEAAALRKELREAGLEVTSA